MIRDKNTLKCLCFLHFQAVAIFLGDENYCNDIKNIKRYAVDAYIFNYVN